MLSLRDVHVHIGKLHILQGVSLEVKEGECAALLGCSEGTVKSQTARGLDRLRALLSDELTPAPATSSPRR